MKKTLLLSLTTATILMASIHENHDHDAHGGFDPSITLIGDFSYVNRNKELHETSTPGFAHAHEGDAHNHSEPHGKERFNFNYAELEVVAPIDEYIELKSTFHLGEDSFEVEELYGTTHNRDGMNYKIGKFLSNFGLNNSKHFEMWDFAQQPLINNALFGDHGLNEKGISLSWNNKNFTVGYELLSGENEMSFGTSEIEHSDGNISVEGANSPELNVAYLRYKNRIGSTFVNTGLSYASGTSRQNHTSDDEPHAIKGDTKIIGADITFKFPFTRTRNLTWSTEYIQREIKGTEHKSDKTQEPVKFDQSGLYTSLVYTINPKWKTGLQYNKILKNDVIEDGTNTNKPDDLKTTSLMVEHYLSEHNRLRLQYNKDESKYDANNKHLSYNEIIFQWTFAFSTGEHKH